MTFAKNGEGDNYQKALKTRLAKMNKRKKTFLVALEQNLGIVSNACRHTGISRSVYYKWHDEDMNFRLKAEEINDVVIDFVETKFYKKIKEEGDTTAMIFFLKSKGKKRGWNERSELALSGSLGVALSADERAMYDEADVEKLEKIKKIIEGGERIDKKLT